MSAPAMRTWIALLRGINVGGNNMLPMQELRALLGGLGHADVQTYIQSGNCVFRSKEKNAEQIAGAIETAIETKFGFRPQTFMLSLEALKAAIAANPYPQGSEAPKSVHFFFLVEPAKDADLDALKNLASATEAFHLTPEVFYLLAPDGIGRSKLAEKIQRFVPVPMTGRNFRTVLTLAGMSRALESQASQAAH